MAEERVLQLQAAPGEKPKVGENVSLGDGGTRVKEQGLCLVRGPALPLII